MRTDDPIPGFTLIGEDGNAFAIMGRFSRSARRAGWTRDEVDEVINEVMQGSYDNLLTTLMPYMEDDDDPDD